MRSVTPMQLSSVNRVENKTGASPMSFIKQGKKILANSNMISGGGFNMISPMNQSFHIPGNEQTKRTSF